MHAKLIRLRAQIVKELLCLLRDPKSRTIMVGPPLIQLFVFSFAMTLEIQNIDLALLNRDAGSASVEFVQQLQASRLVKRIHVAHDEAEVARLIDTQQVLAGVILPELRGGTLAAHDASTLGLIRYCLDRRRA